MSSDSDSDLCDFSSDLTEHLSKGQDKFWKSFKAKQNGETSKDVPEPETHNLTTEEDVEEPVLGNDEPVKDSVLIKGKRVVKVKDKPVEDCNLYEKTTVNVPVRDRKLQGNIVDKLNELSETVKDILKDNGRQLRGRKGARGRKRCAPAVRKKPVKKRGQSNVVPLLTVDSSDDEVTIISPSDNNTRGPADIIMELDPTLTVRILWKSSETKMFKVKKFQPLQCIHEYFKNEAKVDPKLLYFTLDDKYIDLQNNSYVSLRLDDNKLIEGGMLPESCLANRIQCPKVTDKSLLRFKVQYNAGRKKEFTVRCRQSDLIEFILWQIVKEIEVPVDKVRLSFDGKFLKASDSIDGLHLEEDDCFDLEVVKC